MPVDQETKLLDDIIESKLSDYCRSWRIGTRSQSQGLLLGFYCTLHPQSRTSRAPLPHRNHRPPLRREVHGRVNFDVHCLRVLVHQKYHRQKNAGIAMVLRWGRIRRIETHVRMQSQPRIRRRNQTQTVLDRSVRLLHHRGALHYRSLFPDS